MKLCRNISLIYCSRNNCSRMSIINKLAVRGIRSFGNDNQDEQVRLSWNFMFFWKSQNEFPKFLVDNFVCITTDIDCRRKWLWKDNHHRMSQICTHRWTTTWYWPRQNFRPRSQSVQQQFVSGPRETYSEQHQNVHRDSSNSTSTLISDHWRYG